MEERKKNYKTEKFLPIGTVVALKNKDSKFMITGFLPTTDISNSNERYDYCGVEYPIGTVTLDFVFAFNHSQIAKIYHLGLYDDELHQTLNKELKKLQEQNDK